MDWVNGTRIQRFAEMNDLVVVMPSGENSFYVDMPNGSDNYGDFIGRELVELTRKIFPLSHKREDTFYWRAFYGRLWSNPEWIEIS